MREKIEFFFFDLDLFSSFFVFSFFSLSLSP